MLELPETPNCPSGDSPPDGEAELSEKARGAELSDLVRRALLQVGEMMALQDKLKEVKERAKRLTPPPAKTDDGAA
jgi:hypothetical protein